MGKNRWPAVRSAGKPLSPAKLTGDFAAKAEVAREGVRALYDAVVAAKPAALRQWKALLGRTHGGDPGLRLPRIGGLAASYGLVTEPLKPDALLFALHTYYVLLVKLLVGHRMARSRGCASAVDKVVEADTGGRLRNEMKRLEAGGIFGTLDVADFFAGDPFSWYTAAWSKPIERLIRRLAARLAQYDPATRWPDPADRGDLLGQLYQGLFPGWLRHRLGEYYTPLWLVDHLFNVVGYSGEPERRLLDPACGSGAFLLTAIRRVRRRYELNRRPFRPGGRALSRQILANVVGFDLNPLAVLAAKANYLMAIADLLEPGDRVEIPVCRCDALLDPPAGAGRFDYVLGNPPWIAWDNLPAGYRRATRPLWERYGLFSLSGKAGRHGGAKKDLSMLITYASADRFLKRGGRLALVVTQTLFQTKGAGDGFRRFRLGPDGDRLGVLRVDDMAALRPFPDAANLTSIIFLAKGVPTRYPVPYVKWSAGGGQPGGFARRGGPVERDGLAAWTYQAEPIEPARPGSPWFLRPEGFQGELARLVGPSDYVAHLGANSGGANGVYWVQIRGRAEGGVLVRNLAETSKGRLEPAEAVIEPDLLYPLVRWADVTRYRAVPSAHILLAQDVVARSGINPAVMRRAYPQTYAYLRRFEPVLSRRAAYRRYQGNKPFYSMYNVGTYTVAPVKVVWRRMDRRIRAAVIEEALQPLLGRRPLIPQETCVLVALRSADEAHYACALLNSSIVNFLVTSHSVSGGKGFGTPSILDVIRLRRFNPDDPRHAGLAASSRSAHAAAARGGDTTPMQRRIDQLAADLWQLGPAELEAITAAEDHDPRPRGARINPRARLRSC